MQEIYKPRATSTLNSIILSKSLFKFFFWIVWSIFSLTSNMYGQLLSPEHGTIIVTYQTDQGSQRLDRIHFWLINDQKERTLFPKKDEFVSNSHTPNERTVVITHLPAGHYRIEFLIPNTDQLFEQVPTREISLSAGAVVKIEQMIRLRALSTQPSSDSEDIALIISNQPYSPAQPPPPPYPLPFHPPSPSANFSLSSNQQTGWKLVLQGREIYSAKGSISNLSIPPGENYTILAETLPGYTFYTNPTIPFDLEPGENIRMQLIYQRDTGYLSLQGEVPSQIQTLSVTLYSKDSKQAPIRQNLTSTNGKVSWNSGPLPTGEYTLSYNIPHITNPIENQHFKIEKGQHQIVALPYLSQKGSLHVLSDNPQALR